MALTLIATQTAANYPNDGSNVGTILGPSTLGYKLQVIVGNAPCLISVATVMDPKAGPLAGYQWTNDIPIVAGSGQTVQQSFENAVGFKAKDLIVGTHATVYAVVWEKGDPYPTDPLAAAGTLSSSGLTPPPTPVSTLNIQHNDTLVATQPTLDFEDAAAITWTVVNDAANTRVKVTPVKNAAPAVAGAAFGSHTVVSDSYPTGGTAMLGLSMTITPTVTGEVLLTMFGEQATLTNVAATIQLRYGNGTPPVLGATSAGTGLGSSPVLRGNQLHPLVGLLTGMTIGVTYWFDVLVTMTGTPQVGNNVGFDLGTYAMMEAGG